MCSTHFYIYVCNALKLVGSVDGIKLNEENSKYIIYILNFLHIYIIYIIYIEREIKYINVQKRRTGMRKYYYESALLFLLR